MADPRECRRDRDSVDAASTREFERDETPRLLTDGGEAELESTESEQTESGSEEADAEQESEDESEEESETEEQVDSSEGDEAEPTAEEDAESDEEEETESDEEEETESDEEEPGEQHGIDAEEVYEGEDASGVLHLDLDGLFLDLLGLEVNLNEVTLDVSARPGENNLLGNLLSSVTGLLDGLGSPLEKVTQALGGVKDRLLGLLPGLGGGEDGEETDEDEEATGGILSRIAGKIRGIGSGIVDRIRSTASSIGGWFRRRLSNAIMALPLEDLVARITRTVIQQVVERAESVDSSDVEEAQPDAAEAEEGGQEVEAES